MTGRLGSITKPRQMLLAALAALVAVGMGLSAARAATPPGPPDAPGSTEPVAITTVLYPGWNLVGWVGPSTPTPELFDAIPALRQVSAWDAEEQAYRHAVRRRYDDVPTLTAGMGLWLRLDGSSAVEWIRPVSDDGVLLALRKGRNLVGWTGRDGTPVADAVARLGDELVEALRWEAETQRFALSGPRTDTSNDFREMHRGDALWVELAEDARWWQSGVGRTKFEFADFVSSERRSEAREEMASVITFFAEGFGAYVDDLAVSVPHTPSCWARPGFLKITDIASVCAAHEYFHVLQFALAEDSAWGPGWLAEGAATYAEEAYDGELEFRRWLAPAAASHVASLRHPESAHPGRLNYHLGFLAADWLVDRAGEASLVEYYRQLPHRGSWEEAFEAAFGLAVEDFHDAFDAYRAGVAPPLPHLIDDVVWPVAEFLGDVPASTSADIEAEMDAVHTLLIERFGADPSEYSVYVGSDWDAVADHAARLARNRWWDDRVRRFSLPLDWDYNCSIGVTGWIVHALDCGRHLDSRSYVNAYIRTLLVDKEQVNHSPLWLEAGGAIYVDLSYLTAETATFDDELSRYTGLVQRSTVLLQELASKERWETGDREEHEAASVLAMDWLLERAGEQALFEYFRLLPEEGRVHTVAGGWQAAFEQAFGLTFEEFYEQFEAYRETLEAP